ncbi:MAG: hypothetical protein LBF37_01670 [Rickettsiales bacterium]|nr:hypothetical protein [Rickettsiales bacterium]
MTSIRKTKKIIKIGAALEALGHRLTRMDAPGAKKVSDKARNTIVENTDKGRKTALDLKGPAKAKLGNTYTTAKAVTAAKLAKKSDQFIVAKANKTR